MSTAVNPETPNETQKPSETSPSPAPTTGTSSTPSEFRYGPDSPEWIRGKTAKEALSLIEQQNKVITNFISTGERPQQQETPRPYTNQYGSYVPPTFQQQAPQNTTPAYDPDGYIQRRDIESMAPRMIQEQLNPALQPVIEMTAQGNLAHVQRDNATMFQKYGPEINNYLATIPKNMWTVDNLSRVVKFVKADHVEELASEKASQLVAEMGGNLRSNGSPLPPVAQADPKNTLQSPAIPQDWKGRADKLGITQETIREWCQSNSMTVDQFFAQFEGTAITEVTRSD